MLFWGGSLRITTWRPTRGHRKSASCSAAITTLDIGAAFGVVAVVGPRPAGIVEVTTFRQEAGYLNGRHPDPEGIRFTSAEKDAQRRDFTINGLFYDPLEADEGPPHN